MSWIQKTLFIFLAIYFRLFPLISARSILPMPANPVPLNSFQRTINPGRLFHIHARLAAREADSCLKSNTVFYKPVVGDRYRIELLEGFVHRLKNHDCATTS